MFVVIIFTLSGRRMRCFNLRVGIYVNLVLMSWAHRILKLKIIVALSASSGALSIQIFCVECLAKLTCF